MNTFCHYCKKNTHHEILSVNKIEDRLIERKVQCNECEKVTIEDYRKVDYRVGNK